MVSGMNEATSDSKPAMQLFHFPKATDLQPSNKYAWLSSSIGRRRPMAPPLNRSRVLVVTIYGTRLPLKHSVTGTRHSFWIVNNFNAVQTMIPLWCVCGQQDDAKHPQVPNLTSRRDLKKYTYRHICIIQPTVLKALLRDSRRKEHMVPTWLKLKGRPFAQPAFNQRSSVCVDYRG